MSFSLVTLRMVHPVSIHMSVRPSIHMSVRPSICMSIRPYVYPYVCLLPFEQNRQKVLKSLKRGGGTL